MDATNTNVSEVQFVYVVDGVKEAEDDTATQTDDAEVDQGFVDRLVALFSSDDQQD